MYHDAVESVEEMSCEALRATVPRRASGIAIVSATDVPKRRPCCTLLTYVF